MVFHIWHTSSTSFGTNLCLLFHIVAFDIKVLVIPWHQFVYTLIIPCGRMDIQAGHNSVLQVAIICEVFTSKMLLHFWKQEQVQWCQVRSVRRMLEDVPMELLMQKACVCWAVCGCSLSCNRTIPCESLSLRQFWIA